LQLLKSLYNETENIGRGSFFLLSHSPRAFLSPHQLCWGRQVCPPALQTEIQQLSHHISAIIAYYCHHGLKHGGRSSKFQGGQKVKNNSEYYGEEKKNPIGLKPDELQMGKP